MADEMTPAQEGAAREGFLSNPYAVAYAKAQAEGAFPLQAGGEVEVAGTHVAIWWADRPSIVRVKDTDGVWQAVDLSQGPDAHKLTIEWHAVPGTNVEIREVEYGPRCRWHVRQIGVDPT